MAEKDLEITQGSSFEWLAQINDVNGAPLDMTSYTGGTAGARGMIRKTASAATALKSFTITILNKTGVLAAITGGTLHNMTTADIAGLKADTVGKCYLLIRLTAADTATLAKGTAFYDIEIEDQYGFIPNPKTYEGVVTIKPEYTK